MSQFLVANGPMPTVASQAVVATGTNIITLLQVKPIIPMLIIEWGISFDGSAAATPGKVELMETDVAATVTASVEADVTKYHDVSDSSLAATVMTLGTTATGYTSTGEGTIAVVRMFDPQLIAPTGQYVKQFPLGREPLLQAAKFGRIRVKFAVTVNAYCYMVLVPA